MPNSYKTPGVYVEEIPARVPGIAGVPTALPAFIGYTEFAAEGAYRQPVPIASPAEYAAQFGGAAPEGSAFNLAVQIGLFYANGGGACLVFSAGSYWEGQAPDAPAQPATDWQLATPDAGPLIAALAMAGETSGVTMLVMPEACLLASPEYARVIQALLQQAGTLQDRVAILDLPGCTTATDFAGLQKGRADLVAAVMPLAQFASYGAAYAPALKLLDANTPPGEFLTPPSGAIAGIWARSDATQGVWQAPANIAVTGVADLAYLMHDDEQGVFNVPADGVAVDIIRAFVGRGLLVWGARTLDGNSEDFRYVPVRRTVTYVEQSVKAGLQAVVFEPNAPATWGWAKAMVEDFLTGLWRQGGLQGAVPGDAFSVSCGMGSTMTSQDVINGLLRVQIRMALVRPAEFMILIIEQTMMQPSSQEAPLIA
ncbi:phage tail sheath family protein [Sphingomonas sp. R-74633]|uniref:phage tail sheath family protein n=1 Tax=Sphingomonas sp. R-74633 TaxID=2751188 RepID=UPI0015D1B429|nr:phage tail sheath subtilisin-like domain-containing protein [Sphingomonas sp. R-74633]NYT42011.1 phage tail sheath family protein [Sphingomonas sp. R-74633]